MSTINDESVRGGYTFAESEAARSDLVVNGRRIAFTDTGSGPRVCVLIHGLGGCRRHWAATIPALARTHRVIAVDLPGFGDSELPRTSTIANAVTVIDALRSHCDADRIDLIGHSMGTLVACETATRLPNHINRIVLAGGPITSVLSLFATPITTLRRDPHLANFLIEAATAGLPLPRAAQSLITRTPWARRLALAPYVPNPEAISEEMFGHFLSGIGAPGTLATLRQGFGYDFTPALALARPTLLIGGALDRIAPARDLHRFAAATPAVDQVHILPDTGHLPMLEQPAAFNRLITEFLTAEDEYDHIGANGSDEGVFAET
ncbi:alpha/beta fold hydrolase [Nocardia sp. NPDC058058]|uniref:alpha/beta fold hydrolase n=1 Tax=Nocardia sp. NPDC058058 TaxID=3346317 RepID=UPI0036D9BE2E